MQLPATYQTIHADAVSSLYYDPAVPCSHIVWHGFATSEEFRAACLRAYALTRTHRLSKSINDARQLRIISLDDQQWFLEEYLPMVVELRLSSHYYSASLLPKAYFSRWSTDVIEQALDAMHHHYQGIQTITHYFDNEADARAWLMSLPTTPPDPAAPVQE